MHIPLHIIMTNTHQHALLCTLHASTDPLWAVKAMLTSVAQHRHHLSIQGLQSLRHASQDL